MENGIIIAILVVVLFIALRSTVKHFTGAGGCCGGGSYRTKKKPSGIKFRKIFLIDGMHCANCKRKLEQRINGVEDMIGKVNLKKEELTVYSVREISNTEIRVAVESAGFSVKTIKEISIE